MAQQFYRPDKHRRLSDNNRGVYDDAGTYSPTQRSEQNTSASRGAEKTIGNIDDVLNEPSEPPISEGSGQEQSKAASKEELAGQETAGDSENTSSGGRHRAPETEDTGQDDEAAAGSPKKRGFRGWSKRAKAGLGAGILGLGVGGGMFGFTIISGPLELMHFGQILHDTHLSQQEDAGDARMGRLIRGMREGNVGTTRLSWLSNKLYKNTINRLASKGITLDYGALSIQEGAIVDTAHENSPFKGQPTEEVAKSIVRGTKTTYTIEGSKIIFKDGSWFGPSKVTGRVLKATGVSKVGYLGRVRVLRAFGVMGFHNLGIDRAQLKGTASFTEYMKEKWSKLFKGETPAAHLNASGAQEDNGEVDKDGNKVTDPVNGPNEDLSNSKSVRETLKSIADSKGGKITGGIAAGIGILCILKTVNEKIADIRYIQMVKPLMNIGMDMISIGDQIKSGQDVDMRELGYLSTYLSDDGKDDTGKQVRPKTTWDDAAPIRQNTNRQGGVDMDQGTKDSLSDGSVSWLAWTENGAMDALCSTVGTIITGAVSFVLGVFSAGAISTIAQTLIGIVAIPKIIDWLSNLIAGDAINIAEAKGAAFGNYADYGATLGANEAALQIGGTQLTQAQQTALLESTTAKQDAERSQESFFARAFDPYDSKSITGQLIDANKGSFSANMAALVGGFTHIASTVFHLPATIFSGQAHALSSYQYPFPVYGFSLDDQNNPAVDDPFQNAADAAQILSGAQGQTYIDKAKQCFGVTIKQVPTDDGKMVWDAPATINVSQGVEGEIAGVYSGKYDNNGCKDSSDQNWLKIRFFILDTGMMEGYACSQFDDPVSCDNNNGTTAAAAATPGATGNTTIPTGDTITLAKQIATSPNISFQTRQDSDWFNEVVATGRQTQCGGPAISAKLLGVILTLSQSYKLVLGVFDDGHGCDGGHHPDGSAVDINGVNPINGGPGGTGNQLHFDAASMPIIRQFYQSAGEVLAANGGGGLGQYGTYQGRQCFAGTLPPKVAGVTYFPDSCTHIHMDTRGK